MYLPIYAVYMLFLFCEKDYTAACVTYSTKSVNITKMLKMYVTILPIMSKLVFKSLYIVRHITLAPNFANVIYVTVKISLSMDFFRIKIILF